MRVSTAVTSLVVAVVTAGVGGGVAPASAATAVGCGDTVTGDVYLRADLTCPGSGITVTGDSRVDLRGHRLTGTRGSVGITILGAGEVRVSNGRLSGWRTGIESGPPSDDPDPNAELGSAVVDRVSFSDNQVGVDGSGPFLGSGRSRDLLVTRSSFTGNSTGVGHVFGTLRVETSTFTGNGRAARSVTGSLSLRNSVLTGNEVGLVCDETDCLLERSILRDNATGVSSRTFGATLRHNTFVGSTVAYASDFDWTGAEVTGNSFAGNGTGVLVGVSSRVTLTRNVFTRNTSAIISTDSAPEGEPDDLPTTATLTGNRFHRNQDAVFLHILAELKDNSAVRNTGWGIFAPNATDLGGNTARGNGRSPQCTGVVCG
jgi:hypothetical protein